MKLTQVKAVKGANVYGKFLACKKIRQTFSPPNFSLVMDLL